MANPKSKQRRKIVIFSVIVVALAGLTAFAVFSKREAVIRVETGKVIRTNLIETVVANGKIQPVKQVKISAEVSGEIVELPVKEGQDVKKGDLLVKIRPDTYEAERKSALASHLSAVSSKTLAEANLRKADLEFKRNEDLFKNKLISDSVFLEIQTSLDIAKSQVESAKHQVDMALGSLSRAEEQLAKTVIYSPINGTVSKLNLEAGERVAGNTMMAGTEVMTVAELRDMEARVDIGEIDIVLIALGQCATLEVDAFRDRKFKGTVTKIANSSKGLAASTSSQDATKFEVSIRIDEKESFRPGMSVTAEIQTRSRTNVLCVPVQSVTTRLPQSAKAAALLAKNDAKEGSASKKSDHKEGHSGADAPPAAAEADASGKKAAEGSKPVEVVFLAAGDRAKMVPVKRGINDDVHAEIVEGLTEGQEIISGGYKAISRELEDGLKIKKENPVSLKGAPGQEK